MNFQNIIYSLLTETLFIPEIPNTINFWHGGNLDTINDNFKFKKDRRMYGIGLYLTNNYLTAKKYNKGGRKLYLVTVQIGNDISNSLFNTVDCIEFVKKYCVGSKKKEIIHYVEFYSKENKINSSIFNNIILNHDGIRPINTQNLLNFYINNNVDYELNDTVNGKIMVLYNTKKIVKITQVKPTDKIEKYDL